jgi:RNA polymerase sigma-70 factor, ECF subfamily
MPPPKSTTTELLAAVAAGDREALNTIYRTHASRLFSLAFAILRDRPAASDALQEAFVRIWQRTRQFDPQRTDADTWIAAVVRHAALDIARTRGREAADDASGGSAATRGPAAIDPDAIDPIAATEPGARLRDALRKLEPKQRAAVVLAYVHGLSYAELTTRLNEPAGTARVWVRRGLAAVRDALA